MEGSDGEAVFDTQGPVEPQQFIDVVINAAHSLLDDAFTYAHQKAIEMVGSSGGNGGDEDKLEELSRGVSFIHCLTQTVLNKNMNYWEGYSLERCFSVSDGFVLPKSQEPPNIAGSLQDGFDNTELDSTLDSLRTKLSLVGKEYADLRKQALALEESTLRGSHDAYITELLQDYSTNEPKEISRELGKAAAEMISKVENFKTKKKMECGQIGNANGPLKKQRSGHSWELEDIQEVAGILRNMQ